VVTNLSMPPIVNQESLAATAKLKRTIRQDSHMNSSDFMRLSGDPKIGKPVRVTQKLFEGSGRGKWPVTMEMTKKEPYSKTKNLSSSLRKSREDSLSPPPPPSPPAPPSAYKSSSKRHSRNQIHAKSSVVQFSSSSTSLPPKYRLSTSKVVQYGRDVASSSAQVETLLLSPPPPPPPPAPRRLVENINMYSLVFNFRTSTTHSVGP
jgi:hypothetical protein